MISVNSIPDVYHTTTPYLLVQGAEEFIDIVKKAFDAIKTFRMSMPDGAIGHAEIRLGDSVIMFSEAQGGRIQTYANWDLFVCRRL